MNILGLTFGHDSAACLIADGAVVADIAEERLTRIKHDGGFPANAVAECLRIGGIAAERLDVLALPGASLIAGAEARFALSDAQSSYLAARKPRESRIRRLALGASHAGLPTYFERFGLSPDCRFHLADHHVAHAAAAHFTRGAAEPALVVTMDGIGDGVSIALWRGEGARLEPIKHWGAEASLGWSYGMVTEALGWQHGDGEGKTMGLAPYGDPDRAGTRLDGFFPIFRDGELAVPHDFGAVTFTTVHGVHHWHFAEAAAIGQIAEDIGRQHVAARAQQILEQQAAGFIGDWMARLGLDRLACAGGVFLNVKLNQRIGSAIKPREHWVFPNPGDAGLAMGAALHAWHSLGPATESKKLHSLALGPAFGDGEIRALLDERRLSYRVTGDAAAEAARLLAEGRIVGWFQGRMEAGPRALGNRSILMRADVAENKDVLNRRVKFREGFRPFCPSLLAENRADYLAADRDEPFMITSFDARPARAKEIAAVVHVDGTVRPQTVDRVIDPLFHRLIACVGERTGTFAVMNTSFNIRGEPIVCHPRDAIRCFFDSGMDALVIGGFVLEKAPQGAREN